MDQLNLSSEDRLLLYCARTSMNEDITHKVKGILNDCLDWDYIVESSMRHDISPLLYWNLSKIDNGKDAPEEVIAKLRKLYYGNAARNMLLYDELSKVLKAFKDVGIDVIVLKGAFLAEAVYKNIGLRPMGDVDILVRREDLRRAKKKMSELEYAFIYDNYPEAFNEQFGCELEYFKKVNKINLKGLQLELHWDFMPMQKCIEIEIGRIWRNAQAASLANIDVLAMRHEDLLLYLYVHLKKHRFVGLRWFCDITEIVKCYKLNWEYIIESAKRYRISMLVYYVLYLGRELVDCPIPADVLDKLRPNRFKMKLFESIINQKKILHLKYDRGNDISPFYSILFDVLLMDKTPDIVKYFMRLFFPPAEQLSIIYSIPKSKKAYFYYFVHPIRVGFKGIKLLFSCIFSLLRLSNKE